MGFYNLLAGINPSQDGSSWVDAPEWLSMI